MVKEQSKYPLGITVFGVIIVVTSLLQLNSLTSWLYYQWLFNALPEDMLRVRYFISIALRTLGFVSGIGILLHKDLFRKIAIGISVFTVATIYWKHPLYGVSKHARVVIDWISRSNCCYAGLSQPPLIKIIEWSSLISLCAVDVGFALWLIYYFTRPRIKAYFKK